MPDAQADLPRARSHPDARIDRATLVTGVGSMPGTDSAEATRIVAGELDVPHVVELPARGPGADLIGRTLALLVAQTGEFGAETTPSGWRLSGGRAGGAPSRPMRLGIAWVAEDSDRLEEALQGFAGPVKLQVTGPWTLAAGLESPRGHRVLADSGLCADLASALAETVGGRAADLRRRVPGADVVVQLDEPSLPGVLAGGLRTPSGRGAVRVPEPAEVSAALSRVTEAARDAGAVEVVAHCCAGRVPFDLFERSGFSAVGVDLAAVGPGADEALGRWWDAVGRVVLGVAPVLDPQPAARRTMPESLARSVADTWGRIGFGAADVAERTWLSPACGLAGASPAWARVVGSLLREAAGLLESAD